MNKETFERAGNDGGAGVQDLAGVLREILEEMRQIRDDLREIRENRLIAADVNWED